MLATIAVSFQEVKRATYQPTDRTRIPLGTHRLPAMGESVG
jgi:hypothetical protein